MIKSQISYEDFDKVDIRVGKVIKDGNKPKRIERDNKAFRGFIQVREIENNKRIFEKIGLPVLGTYF